MSCRPSAVEFAERHVNLERSAIGRRPGQRKHHLDKLIRSQSKILASQLSNEFGVVPLEKNGSPGFKVPRHERLAAPLKLQPADQEQQRRCWSKGSLGRRGGRIGSAQRRVKERQSILVGEICLLNSANPRQDVKIGDQPTLVLSQQLRDESGRGRGAGSN